MVTLQVHEKNLSTNMLHLVCSGCSFTRQYRRLGLDGTDTDFLTDPLHMWRWPHHIQTMYDNIKVYNLGNPTNDNTVIAHSVIKKITELLNEGISTNNIKIIVQWSDQDRDSYFFSKEVVSEYDVSVLPPNQDEDGMLDDIWSHLSTFAETNHFKDRWGYYLLNGGFMWDHIKYPTDILVSNAKYISPEQSLIRLCTNYILLQNFCKLNNLDWTSFSLAYNFYDSTTIRKAKRFNHTIDTVYTQKNIHELHMNFDTNNPYIDYLIKNVDFSTNYFYQDDSTNIGGISEWAVKNFVLDEDYEIFMEHNLLEGYTNFDNFYEKNFNCSLGHVSQQMNKKFVKTILKSFLEKDLE